MDTLETLPSPNARNGPPTLLASHSPTRGECHNVWLAVRVSTVAENSEQAERKAFDAFENLVLSQASDAEGKQAQVHLPPLLFNEVAVHVLKRMSEIRL